jgi:hypothetical protein
MDARKESDEQNDDQNVSVEDSSTKKPANVAADAAVAYLANLPEEEVFFITSPGSPVEKSPRAMSSNSLYGENFIPLTARQMTDINDPIAVSQDFLVSPLSPDSAANRTNETTPPSTVHPPPTSPPPLHMNWGSSIDNNNHHLVESHEVQQQLQRPPRVPTVAASRGGKVQYNASASYSSGGEPLHRRSLSADEASYISAMTDASSHYDHPQQPVSIKSGIPWSLQQPVLPDEQPPTRRPVRIPGATPKEHGGRVFTVGNATEFQNEADAIIRQILAERNHLQPSTTSMLHGDQKAKSVHTNQTAVKGVNDLDEPDVLSLTTATATWLALQRASKQEFGDDDSLKNSASTTKSAAHSVGCKEGSCDSSDSKDTENVNTRKGIWGLIRMQALVNQAATNYKAFEQGVATVIDFIEPNQSLWDTWPVRVVIFICAIMFFGRFTSYQKTYRHILNLFVVSALGITITRFCILYFFGLCKYGKMTRKDSAFLLEPD